MPYFSLIAAGKAKTVDGLRLLKSYKQEESYIVWNNVAQQLVKQAEVTTTRLPEVSISFVCCTCMKSFYNKNFITFSATTVFK